MIGAFLETAHPAKFVEVVEHILQEKINIPAKLMAFAAKEKVAFQVPVDAEAVKRVLQEK